MYPYPRHVTEDEPTMADVRGVLPGQRPPVDFTVLDEPTSEVPVIRPASETDGEPAAAEASPQESDAVAAVPETEPPAETEQAPEDETVPNEQAIAEPDAEAELPPEHVAEAEPEAATEAATEPATEPAPEPEAATEPEAVTEPAPEPEALIEPTPEPEALIEPELEVEPEREVEPEAAAGPAVEPETTVLEPETASETSMTTETDTEAETDMEVPEVVGGVAEAEAADSFPRSEMAKMAWPPPATEEVADTTAEAVDIDTAEAAAAVVTEATAPEPAATEPEPELAPEAAAADLEPAAAAAAVEPEPANPRAPGEVAELPIALWSDESADRLRGLWRDLQVTFIDDPDAAVAGAKSLVTEAVQELADTLLAAQDALDPYHGSARVDTETMRVAMRRYREFLDRVLAL